MAKKKSVLDFHEMKKKGDKITFLTAYDFPTAQFAEDAGLDMLLVGDSLGMSSPASSANWAVGKSYCGINR